MDSLAPTQQYVENGQNHERSDLTDLVFKDLDYHQYNESISFFRSDFSRSRFINCSFHRNIFGRADFIDAYIKNTDFDSVDFGSCLLKNALLEKVLFRKNNYRGVAIQYSYFKSCVFRDENFITNMYNCNFLECTFINCTFVKSSLDSNTFTNCEFIKVDMSECIAENLKFDNCALRDVYLCANLWTTYLYKNTDIYNLGFKYRGEIVDIWQGNPQEFISDLLRKGLYFEYLNAIIIGGLTPIQELSYELQQLISRIVVQPPQIRKSTIVKILDMLYFYRNYDKIAFEVYLKMYVYLANYNWGDIPFEEVIIYQSKLYKIRKVIEHLDFDLSYIMSIPPTSICISRYHINETDGECAIAHLENAFDIANNDFCGNAFAKPLIKVIRQEEGSIILTIASATLLTLLVSYAAKKVMHNLISIQIEQGIKKQLLKQLEKESTDLSDIRKSCALAQKYDFFSSPSDSKQIANLSSELTKGKVLDIILDFLF